MKSEQLVEDIYADVFDTLCGIKFTEGSVDSRAEALTANILKHFERAAKQ